MARKQVPKRTPEIAAKFFKALADGLSVTGAAEHAGIGRNTVYDWRKDDKEFAAAMDAASESGTDGLEDEARRRAVDGIREMVLYQGKPVLWSPQGYDAEGKATGPLEPLYRHRYSDTMLAMQLNGRRPEKYRHRPEATPPPDAGPALTLPDMLEIARRIGFVLERAARQAVPTDPPTIDLATAEAGVPLIAPPKPQGN